MSRRRVAAIDCGTNTIKLLVADIDRAAGTQDDLVREMRIVRLGQGVDRTRRLADEALDRVFAAVDEYCAAGDLLVLPRSPELVALSRWTLGELVRQYEGGEPQPWPGPF